jgi:hypothetical protein
MLRDKSQPAPGLQRRLALSVRLGPLGFEPRTKSFPPVLRVCRESPYAGSPAAWRSVPQLYPRHRAPQIILLASSRSNAECHRMNSTAVMENLLKQVRRVEGGRSSKSSKAADRMPPVECRQSNAAQGELGSWGQLEGTGKGHSNSCGREAASTVGWKWIGQLSCTI